MKYKSAMILLLIVCCYVIGIGEAIGQCPMCRMSAESNLQGGGSAGKGLNTGILYMLAAPYVLVGTIGYLWWRSKKKEDPTT